MTRGTLARRGSIYVTVLGASMLVLVIGLSAVVAGRVQARTAGSTGDFAEARTIARSGLELAMLAIYNDPYWRTRFGNGTWFSERAIGAGRVTVTAADPVDGDVPTGDNHAVVLTSTGMKGNSRYSMSVRMEVGPRVGTCLEVPLCAGTDLNVNGATLTSDRPVSSNMAVNASNGAIVNADVEAFKQVSGSTYSRTTQVTKRSRTLPDKTTALSSYIAAGTSIPRSSLPQFSSAELIANGKFEIDLSDWTAIGPCTLKRNTNLALVKQGLASLRVTGRHNVTDMCGVSVPISAIKPGHRYAVNIPVYSAGDAMMRVSLTLTTDTGTFRSATPDTSVVQAIWTTLKADAAGLEAPAWTGNLLSAVVTVESDSANKDYYIDDASFEDMTYVNGAYVIERQLLTPNTNPFGSPNAKGIYVVDCGGKRISIANSRIVGTLVVLNSPEVRVQGAMLMEPATANAPVLLTNSDLFIGVDASPLSESTLRMNFNPPGAPSPYFAGSGVGTNNTEADSLSAGLNGLVYCTKDMEFTGAPSINGLVVANGKITVKATSLGLAYNNIYVNDPPPGFLLGSVVMRPVPGTWARAAN